MRSDSGDPALEREYREWLQSAHSPAHSRRTAAVNAAFFLPHLRPGMRLLDAGCGPGSITVGLAEAVAPGEVVGIDTSPRAVAAAREAASRAGRDNVRFEVADLFRLPFEAESFDAVFAHAVLQHVPDAGRAVHSLARIVRPAGVVGLADADFHDSLLWPSPPEMRRALRLMLAVRQHSGGDLRVGRKLGGLLAAAGLEDITCSAVAPAPSGADVTRATGEFWASYYGSPELGRFLQGLGIASESQLSEASAAWRAWGASPGAVWGTWWCRAVGRKA